MRAAGSPNHPWEPGRLKKLADFKLGWMHGAQYWINPKSTPETIERDFKAMAEEDHINYVRLAFWVCYVGKKIDYTLFDACFEAAARHNIKLNPALPQIPGWQDGKSDDPAVRQAFKEHIAEIIRRYKNKPALGFWTVEMEPSRNWKSHLHR